MDTIICKNCVLDSQIPEVTINREKYHIHPYAIIWLPLSGREI
jgi:hypothetical protein